MLKIAKNPKNLGFFGIFVDIWLKFVYVWMYVCMYVSMYVSMYVNLEEFLGKIAKKSGIFQKKK